MLKMGMSGLCLICGAAPEGSVAVFMNETDRCKGTEQKSAHKRNPMGPINNTLKALQRICNDFSVQTKWDFPYIAA